MNTIKLADKFGLLLADPKHAKKLHAKIWTFIDKGHGVTIDMSKILVLTPQFVEIAFTKFGRRSQELVYKRLRFICYTSPEQKYLVERVIKPPRKTPKKKAFKEKAPKENKLQS